MSTTELIELIEKLPADKQKEVEDFVLSKINVDSLANYTLPDANNRKTILAEPSGENGRGYGSLKGLIWISDDFNEPLDDFKDYM
jgi:hypothetical protein